MYAHSLLSRDGCALFPPETPAARPAPQAALATRFLRGRAWAGPAAGAAADRRASLAATAALTDHVRS